jgi:hypothetical protein
MEQASTALIKRRYFECEKAAASALRRAHAINDYDRMARIILPLQESRRLKRELASDTGKVFIIAEGELPQPGQIKSGCYLVVPPRVGVDGRAIREMADDAEVPVVVVVREPTTREGLCPVVSIGPVTIRAKVEMPTPGKPKSSAKKPAKKPGRNDAVVEPSGPGHIIPGIEWFLETNEALGDAAIAAVPPHLPAANRVDLLLERLEAMPDHEKLHQRLMEACRDALREPPRKRRPMSDEFEGEDEGDEDDEI